VKIPDEIVREAWVRFNTPSKQSTDSMRAALQVGVDYALEEAALAAEHLNGWSGDNIAEHIAKCIRARKDKP
jgi:hypothetical protein